MIVQILHRVEPARNMARFYRVEILPDLFGWTTVERTWGRIGSRGQRMMVSFPSEASAKLEACRLVRCKLRRNYIE
jgi:predicted DNA-binding WGR domain protein